MRWLDIGRDRNDGGVELTNHSSLETGGSPSRNGGRADDEMGQDLD